jgi:nucleoid-associated protein YgaU
MVASGFGTPRTVPGSVRADQPVPLRTAPSELLTQATRANLVTADQSRNGPSGSGDLASIGARIRRETTSDGASGAEPIRPAVPLARPNPAIERPVVKTPVRPVPPAWPRQHRIESGDNLYRLAIEYYGDSQFVEDIVRANPGMTRARNLKIGQILVMPDPQGHLAVAAPLDPVPVSRQPDDSTVTRTLRANQYTVRDGDSFYTIALRKLGDGRRWEELYRLNKSVVKNNPKRLKSGMVLTLPPMRPNEDGR